MKNIVLIVNVKEDEENVKDSVEIFKLHEYKHCAVCKCKRKYRKCK